jgi:hypothetical protein
VIALIELDVDFLFWFLWDAAVFFVSRVVHGMNVGSQPKAILSVFKVIGPDRNSKTRNGARLEETGRYQNNCLGSVQVRKGRRSSGV